MSREKLKLTHTANHFFTTLEFWLLRLLIFFLFLLGLIRVGKELARAMIK